MIFMGNGNKAIIIWAVVALIITGATLFVVTQVINDTNETVDESIDRAFDESDEAQDRANQELKDANKGQQGQVPSAEEIQEDINQQLEDAGVGN